MQSEPVRSNSIRALLPPERLALHRPASPAEVEVDMNGDVFAYGAVAITMATTTSWFWLMRQVKIPDNRAGFLLAWLLGVGLGLYALAQGVGAWPATASAIVAILAGVLFTLLFTISAQKASAEGVTLGAPLLDFSAPDDSGTTFQLGSVAGRPVLLKFFRGHW